MEEEVIVILEIMNLTILTPVNSNVRDTTLKKPGLNIFHLSYFLTFVENISLQKCSSVGYVTNIFLSFRSKWFHTLLSSNINSSNQSNPGWWDILLKMGHHLRQLLTLKSMENRKMKDLPPVRPNPSGYFQGFSPIHCGSKEEWNFIHKAIVHQGELEEHIKTLDAQRDHKKMRMFVEGVINRINPTLERLSKNS